MQNKWVITVFLIICMFLGITNVYAEAQISQIEIFDIAKGEVVKRVANTVTVQKEVQLCLETITNLVQPLGETPHEGMVVRIPLDPPILVESKWLSTISHEVFLIRLPQKTTFLIVFNQERTPYMVDFSHNPNKLLSLIGLSPDELPK